MYWDFLLLLLLVCACICICVYVPASAVLCGIIIVFVYRCVCDFACATQPSCLMAGAARRRQSTTAEASWAISSAPSQAKSYSLPPFEKDTNVEIWTSVYKWRTTISITVKDGLLTQKDFSNLG